MFTTYQYNISLPMPSKIINYAMQSKSEQNNSEKISETSHQLLFFP
jgi:hypothetical protein